MRRKHMQGVLMGFGLWALLMAGAGAWGMAAAQTYRGQVREITIDQCGLDPGTCEGSLVLAQARGQEVTLTIPAGTTMQRGDERVHLEQLGIGNYVLVQAASQPGDLDGTLQGSGREWTWGKVDVYQRSPVNSDAQGG